MIYIPDTRVDPRDSQIAAARTRRPRTTMRHDPTRTNPDRHLNYILAVHMAPAHQSPTMDEQGQVSVSRSG